MTPTKLYRVTLPQHEVQYRGYSTAKPPPVYTIPKRVMSSGGTSPEDAVRRIVSLAHTEANVPHFRHMQDQSVAVATVVEIPPPNHKPPK